MNEILEQISIMMKENFWLAPLLALAAGILTSFTPCSLSSIPLVISYMGELDKKRSKEH